jgi:hypothetical protein
MARIGWQRHRKKNNNNKNAGRKLILKWNFEQWDKGEWAGQGLVASVCESDNKYPGSINCGKFLG